MDLVLVCWADAAAGGSDGLAARCGLGGELNHAVVGEDDLGAVGDEELVVDGEASFAELAYLVEESRGVQHDSVADDAFAAGTEDAAGNKLQNELPTVNDDGVAGVMAASVSSDNGKLFREDVDDLAFTFIAPLGSEEDG